MLRERSGKNECPFCPALPTLVHIAANGSSPEGFSMRAAAQRWRSFGVGPR